MRAPAKRRWYAIHTQPHAERRALPHLVEQGFEAFLPLYAKRRRHARRVEFRAAPLFPRYLFVTLDLATDRWRSINGTRGVQRIVCFSDRPRPVTEGIVEELISRSDAQGLIPLLPAANHKRGDRVRVRDGLFASALGLFEGVADADRVAILLELLGRKVRVVLDGDLIEAA